MVDCVDDIDNAGGSTQWCLEVIPNGDVTKHSLNWSSEISCLLSDGKEMDSPEIIQAAKNYWLGIPHWDENV